MRNSIYCVTNKTLMHLPLTLLCLSGDTKADLGPHPPPQPWRRKMPCACALSKKTLCCNKLWAQSPKPPSACCSPLPCQSQEETWRGHGGSHLQPSEARAAGGTGGQPWWALQGNCLKNQDNRDDLTARQGQSVSGETESEFKWNPTHRRWK